MTNDLDMGPITRGNEYVIFVCTAMNVMIYNISISSRRKVWITIFQEERSGKKLR